jgi:sterol desaturase/sphingolipid hydroxylase (fatty acid hydroxylase superfamily)
MIDWMVANEAMVRSACFGFMLLAMMLWETLRPKRERKHSRWLRWSQNISLVFVNSFLIRLILPLATIGVAQYAQDNQIGLFHQLGVAPVITFVLTLVIFDLAIYWQHRLFHKVPFLWALHKVHHVDQDIDVTTGSRFHTLEILLSLLIKFALVLLLGPSVFAVMIFEIVLNATAMFNHANLALPKKWDTIMRWVLVTPDMHRVHHSTIMDESNRNFGFNLSCWDRLFSSYQDQPAKGHLGMSIGVAGYNRVTQNQYLPGMLWLPFVRPELSNENKGTKIDQ